MKRTADAFELPRATSIPTTDPEVEKTFIATERPSRLVARALSSRPDLPTPKTSVPSARLSVEIPADALRKMKFEALEHRTTVREIVTQLLARAGYCESL